MRVLVCGGRDFCDWDKLHFELYSLLDNRPDQREPFVVIQGGAKGADFLAKAWAKYMRFEYNTSVEEFPADWKKHGRAAGYIRNKQMLVEGKPDLVVAFPGGAGTKNMIDQARKAKVEVIIID